MTITPGTKVVIAGLMVLGGVLFFGSNFADYREAERHLTPKSVSVSGYYRSDGSYVRPYHRRPPGGVAHDAPYERAMGTSQLFMLLGIVISVSPLVYWLVRKHNQSHQRKSPIVEARSGDNPTDKGHDALAICNDTINRAEESVADVEVEVSTNSCQSATAAPARRDPVITISSPARAAESKVVVLSAPSDIKSRGPFNVFLVCCACGAKVIERIAFPEVALSGMFDSTTLKYFCRDCSQKTKFCNCASCGILLQSAGIAGRIMDRPYCASCLTAYPTKPGRYGRIEDTGPWQDIAIRRMEDT
jgi:hypothetical protein